MDWQLCAAITLAGAAACALLIIGQFLKDRPRYPRRPRRERGEELHPSSWEVIDPGEYVVEEAQQVVTIDSGAGRI